MDTNLIAILERLLAAKAVVPVVANGQNTILVAGMIINAFGAGLAAVLAYLAKREVASAKDTAIKTNDAVQKIEVHTNSERTATLKLVEEQRTALMELSNELSTLKEQKRGQDIAKDVASGIAHAKMSPLQEQPGFSIARTEAAAEKTEIAAEKTEAAAEKTEEAVDVLTDSEISEMVRKLNLALEAKKSKK